MVILDHHLERHCTGRLLTAVAQLPTLNEAKPNEEGGPEAAFDSFNLARYTADAQDMYHICPGRRLKRV
ncbi:hypothetical protein ACFFLM_22390 [Deinococcus oregonensis]|uniref:Uncharacterized protein n=1 Tax=Deinococcus oregonensis TaxID=1805970 RepID=A0ABV6B4P2_9DEIO